MSAIGAALARTLGALGGPTTAAVVVAGGLVVGALGGGLVGAGSQAATAGGTLAVYPCPGTGAPLAFVRAGQQLLATGRTEDSSWLRIHFPEPGRTEAWVQAGPLESRGNLASLPVAECAPELAAAPPSLLPQATLTALQDNPPTPPPTPEPTPTPTPTPTPSAAPDAGPSVTGLTVSTGKISYDTGGYCPNAVKKATFTVKASDDVGIAAVALFWRAPGAATFAKATMTRTAGTTKRGTWTVALSTTSNSITKAGKLAYYAIGTDTAGTQKRIPVNGSDSITVDVCVNTGPAITGASSSSGSSLYWDPLGVGSCQTATNITATIKDSDGVRSATLFYRKPGSSSWSSKRMDDATIKGKWYANLDTLGDRITIPNPPTGNLRWYIKAVDDKGVSTQSNTSTITIRRCDSEAQFDGVFPVNSSYACDSTATLVIATYANDPDQPADGLSVVFHWSLENRRTGDGPISGTMKATVTKGNYYRGTSKTFNGKTYYDGYLKVYAITTDRYGGTTKTPTSTYVLGCG